MIDLFIAIAQRGVFSIASAALQFEIRFIFSKSELGRRIQRSLNQLQSIATSKLDG